VTTTLTSPGKPFTAEAARAAGRRSGLARRERALERDRYAQAIDLLVAEFGGRGKLGEVAFASTMKLALAAVSGEIAEPETPLDRLRLAEAARIVHNIARLEVGESTSNVARANVDLSTLQKRLAALSDSQDA
jgi:hypothetical protein